MAEWKESKHVVMFPFMAQGHFIPFLTLAKVLASQGFTVSFLTTTASSPKLQSQALGSSIRFVSLSLPPIRGLPLGCESTDVLPPIKGVLLFIYSHKLSQPFEDWLLQVMAETSRKPACIISDVFLPWTTQSASKFGIPCVVFHTTGAMAASLQQYLFTNPVSEMIGDHQIIEIRDRSMNVNLRRSELPLVLPVIQQAYGLAKESCSATLVNTFDGLEAEYVRYLQESTGKPVWSVASSLRKPHFGTDKESECIRWLDSQKENSVLYVSFGSQGFLSQDQTKALARGIAASNQPFIWSIKDPVGGHVNSCDFLPEGFIEATRTRGIVIHGWVPQLLILSHPSTACFLSHCGWNSTLESISAGLPMLAWPLILDQFANAKLVVEQFRIGLQICEGFDAIPNSDIVENTVKAAMTTEIGKEMRQRALQIKESINEVSCKLSVKAFVSYILSLGFKDDK
ncbi:hypothetical protein SUGI_0724360 [Cryptomeria japonica]|uniref:probable UDP-glucosyl transferase 73B6 n=1 Tax=Cryptomeria japonica TaxID=3369 RepID=UPI002414AD28|nr:probable UDP-glucosyl transferase 73B6 [Cryptomeria japonica]GLJ36108.1 hypothetical protein SUGI_0724360 [Cryptomeria japonica]